MAERGGFRNARKSEVVRAGQVTDSGVEHSIIN